MEQENEDLRHKVRTLEEEAEAKNKNCHEEHIKVMEQMQNEIAEKDEKLAKHGKISKFQTDLKLAMLKKVTIKMDEEMAQKNMQLDAKNKEMMNMQQEVRAGSSSALMRKIEEELKGYF